MLSSNIDGMIDHTSQTRTPLIIPEVVDALYKYQDAITIAYTRLGNSMLYQPSQPIYSELKARDFYVSQHFRGLTYQNLPRNR